MEKKIINTSNAPEPIGPYNQAVLFGNIIFISGQIPLDPKTGNMQQDDITAETNMVMQNLKAILNEAGMDFSNVLKTTIFMTDLKQFGIVNEIYGSYFTGDYPARETVQIAALPKGANVEISMIAGK